MRTYNTQKVLNDTLAYYLTPYQIETYREEVRIAKNITTTIKFLSNGNHQIIIEKEGKELFHDYLNNLYMNYENLFLALEGKNV